MGMNSRYVSKATYAKQKKASKPAPSKKVTPKTTPKSSSSTPKVGATKRLQGRMVRWNGKRWTAAGTGPKKPTPTPRKASATPKPPTGRFTAPKVPKAKVAPTAASRIVNAAKRAASSPAARNTLKILGKAGQLISGDGSGQALMGAVTASNLIDAARGSTAKERNAKTKGQSGLSKNQQETLRKQADANRRRRNEKSRVRKVGNPTDKTRATYNKPTSKPKAKSSPKPKAKPDNRSTLTKEIDGLTKFIATHKGKKGMERGLSQARKSLALKKKKKSQRSTTMSGNTSGSSRSIG